MTALGADLQDGPTPLTGGLVALLWTAVVVAAGAIALRRRDA
jgi:hypothetical protein